MARTGSLPDGYTLDSLLTLEEFSRWRGESIITTRSKARMGKLPGLVKEPGRLRVHPRTFLRRTTPGFWKHGEPLQ